VQQLPLEGVRVVDFTTAQAGAHCTQWLGVMGAEVIKIESRVRPDVTRLSSRAETLDQSASFVSFNSGKKSITLNMNQPKAVQIVKELVKLSDVVTENFGGATMERWGLGYPELKRLKPDIIVFATSGYGRTGPRKESPAFAPVVDAFSGLLSVNGYVGGIPNVVGNRGWTDAMAAVHGAFVILAALYHRSNTGEGQYIDASMTELNANVLGELVIDYAMNERVAQPVGNRDNIMAPHGCYRCLGEDKWVAVAVSSEQEWQAFCNALGNPEWTKKEEFSDGLSRLNNQEELNRLIEEWTKQHSHYEVMEILQKVGVMAGACLTLEELKSDRQLREREFLLDIEQPLIGKLCLSRMPWRLSGTPGGNYYRAPLLGEHNNYVFGELLGMPEQEIRRLEEEKVIY